MTGPRSITPLGTGFDVTVELPGSKSLTNRALLAAGLAHGTSTLERFLVADDTDAMVGCLRALGITVEHTGDGAVAVQGGAGTLPVDAARLDARQSGTTARFLLPVLGTGTGPYVLDGHPQLRARPMGDGIDALRSLGASVRGTGVSDHLPVEVAHGPVAGGRVDVRGDASSQFLSGLLLAGPVLRDGLVVHVTTELVSQPYVDMTVSVMRAFGAAVERADPVTWVVTARPYRATTYEIEPDASAASYFFAAAALCGGRVTVEGLGAGSLQGDLAFVDVLDRMGASVASTPTATTVEGTGGLNGVDVDLGALSDTAPTLAVVAAFAAGPSEVRGIGFIRRKETDRIAAVVRELRRCGIDAHETDDGFVVQPGTPRAATIETYDDHRMAMSFALLGLQVPGIAIANPGCVAKTFPGFWDALDTLRGPAASGG